MCVQAFKAASPAHEAQYGKGLSPALGYSPSQWYGDAIGRQAPRRSRAVQGKLGFHLGTEKKKRSHSEQRGKQNQQGSKHVKSNQTKRAAREVETRVPLGQKQTTAPALSTEASPVVFDQALDRRLPAICKPLPGHFQR